MDRTHDAEHRTQDGCRVVAAVLLCADAQSILSFFIGLRTILIDDLRIIRINIIILYRNGWRIYIYNIIYDIIYMIIML